jgi:hypothetical protein
MDCPACQPAMHVGERSPYLLLCSDPALPCGLLLSLAPRELLLAQALHPALRSLALLLHLPCGPLLGLRPALTCQQAVAE